MVPADLRQAIAALRHEIAHLHPEQTPQRVHLENLLADLERQIENQTAHHLSLLVNVKNLVEQFETEHPALTDMLNRLSVLLSNMGV